MTVRRAAPAVQPAAAPAAAPSAQAPAVRSPSQLTNLYRRLMDVTAQQASGSPRLQPTPLPASEARKGCAVVKWIDYSLKYGLGYKLSNGSFGVLFNDNTKMVLAADGE